MSKSVMLTVTALLTGLLVAVSVGPQTAEESGENTPQQKLVLVTTVDMDAGIAFGPDNLSMEFQPLDKIPAHSLDALSDVLSQYAIQRIPAGTVITSDMATENRSEGLAAIPAGYRMCVIHTSLTHSLLPELKPGSRVDVLAYLPQSSTVPVPTTRKVASSARVHEATPIAETDSPATSSELAACRVALLVKQEEVQPLLLAAENGLFRLSLLGHDSDPKTAADDDFTYQQLVASLPARGNPALMIYDQSRQPQPLDADQPQPEPPADLISREEAHLAIEAAVEDAVEQAVAQIEQQQATRQATPQPPHWTMEILTPQSRTNYRWATAIDAPTVTASSDTPHGLSDLQATLQRIRTARHDNPDGPTPK